MTESEALPKWIMRRYALLLQKFGDKEFTREDAMKVTAETDQIMNVLLSRLRRLGWLDVKFNEEDARRRIYTLKSAKQVILEMRTG